MGEIEGERAMINAAVTDLTASIEATPGNETVLNSLQRDHQNLQAQYDSAIARLAEASTGQQIELLLKGERLSLIDSAVPPPSPQGPKQRVLLLASVIAALLVGFAVVIVPELLNRRIRRPAELVSRLQIVPYITVPYIERRRFMPLRAAMRLTMVLMVPALLLATQMYAGPLRSNSEITSIKQ
ncbi:polysaccharide chain length determinant protein, PEP-CTERM locus subfamily [compost metagenome]